MLRRSASLRTARWRSISRRLVAAALGHMRLAINFLEIHEFVDQFLRHEVIALPHARAGQNFINKFDKRRFAPSVASFLASSSVYAAALSPNTSAANLQAVKDLIDPAISDRLMSGTRRRLAVRQYLLGLPEIFLKSTGELGRKVSFVQTVMKLFTQKFSSALT